MKFSTCNFQNAQNKQPSMPPGLLGNLYSEAMLEWKNKLAIKTTNTEYKKQGYLYKRHVSQHLCLLVSIFIHGLRFHPKKFKAVFITVLNKIDQQTKALKQVTCIYDELNSNTFSNHITGCMQKAQHTY